MGILQQQILPPKEIIKLFNTKKIDKEWSFIGYKPSDTAKWSHGHIIEEIRKQKA